MENEFNKGEFDSVCVCIYLYLGAMYVGVNDALLPTKKIYSLCFLFPLLFLLFLLILTTLGRSMPYIDKSYIYVIVDLAKNNLRKTEYKITNFVTGDAWVKLKRGKNKSGIEFRLLRKVWDPAGLVVGNN